MVTHMIRYICVCFLSLLSMASAGLMITPPPPASSVGSVVGAAYTASNQTFTGENLYQNIVTFRENVVMSNSLVVKSALDVGNAITFSSNSSWRIIGVNDTLRIGDTGFTVGKTVLQLNDVARQFSISASNGVYLFNIEFGTPGGSFPPLYFGTSVFARATNNQLNIAAAGGVSLSGGPAMIPRATTSNLTWSSIAAGASATQLITVTGAKIGDGVTVTPATPQANELKWAAQILATNTVQINMFNINLLGAAVPSNGNWIAEVRSY